MNIETKSAAVGALIMLISTAATAGSEIIMVLNSDQPSWESVFDFDEAAAHSDPDQHPVLFYNEAAATWIDESPSTISVTVTPEHPCASRQFKNHPFCTGQSAISADALCKYIPCGTPGRPSFCEPCDVLPTVFEVGDLIAEQPRRSLCTRRQDLCRILDRLGLCSRCPDQCRGVMEETPTVDQRWSLFQQHLGLFMKEEVPTSERKREAFAEVFGDKVGIVDELTVRQHYINGLIRGWAEDPDLQAEGNQIFDMISQGLGGLTND